MKKTNKVRIRKDFQGIHGNAKYHPQDTSWKALWHRCRLNAKTRGIKFNLSMEQVKIVSTTNCTYCGSEPSLRFNVYATKGGKFRTSNVSRCQEGWISHGTIDRVDSSVPYIVDNIVPACFACNAAKGSMSCDEFYCWIGRISSKWAQSKLSAFQ